MRKLYRSLLWSGLVVAGVAACGDDVTVNAPPSVSSVTVGPSGVTIAVGQTLQMAAAVNAASGVATTVAWSTSNVATASVSATGLVTGVAAGSVAITACSTVSTGVCGQATVTVGSSAPAVISIKSITTGNTLTPVILNNVGGQIDVTLNLDAGTQKVSNVQVLIDNVVACEQGFSAIQEFAAKAQAALVASDNPNAALVVEIVCSVNTAAFTPTTGVPKYLNGLRLLTARVNLVGSAPVATPSTSLFFNNVNTFAGSMTVTGGFAPATSPNNGLTYRRGGLSFTVLPVIYTSATDVFASGTLSFGSCSVGGARTVALVAPATGSSAWTATLSNTATTGTTVTSYEFDSTICAASTTATGEVFSVSGVDALGNSALSGALPSALVPVAGIRLDNKGPGAPTFFGNPNGRQNGWINGTVALASSNTGTNPNGWMLNGTADVGVGGYTKLLRTGTGTTAANAVAATASSTPTLPAPSVSNTSYCAVASATDALGNESALPTGTTTCFVPVLVVGGTLAAHIEFGVDTDAPTIAYNDPASLQDQARINGGTIGGEFIVNVADVGTIGVSGMLAGSPVKATVIRREANGIDFATAPIDCVIGVLTSSGTVCSISATGLIILLPSVSTPLTTAPFAVQAAVPGYYTYNATAFDAAGNFTAISATRTIVSDNIAPALTTALFNTPLSGSTATFTANSSDNLDLWKVNYRLTYGVTLAGPIAYPSTIINTFNAAVLLNSNVAAGITINGFMRQVQNATNAAAPLTVGGADKPSLLNGTLFDQAGNTAGPITTTIPPSSVTTGVSYVKAPLDPQEFGTWAVSGPSAATNVSTNGGPAAAVNPLSVLLQADAFGRTATFLQPFTRVDFYALSGGNLVQIGTGTLAPIFDDGSPFGRRFRWTLTWTPGTAFGTAAQSIFAIGVNANGDALVTAANGFVTTTNP